MINLYEVFLNSTDQGDIYEKYKPFNHLFQKENSRNLFKQLMNKSLIIKEDQPCLDSKGNELDAFVSRLDLSGEICISSFRLSRLPEYVLDESIMILLFHEISHLLGFNEEEAQAWGRFIEQYLPQIIKKDITQLGMGVYSKFINDSRLIKNSLIDSKNGDYQKAILNIAELKGVIATTRTLISYSKYASSNNISADKLKKTLLIFENLEKEIKSFGDLITKKERLYNLGMKCLSILPVYENALNAAFEVFTGMPKDDITNGEGILSEPHFAVCLPEGDYWQSK